MLFLTAMVVSVMPEEAQAQSQNVSVYGTVITVGNVAVAGARVDLYIGSSSSIAQTAYTNGSGSFMLSASSSMMVSFIGIRVTCSGYTQLMRTFSLQSGVVGLILQLCLYPSYVIA